MRHAFKAAALAGALLLATPAPAQVPPEVMEPYRTYAAEMKSAEPDRAVMGEAARAAWLAAEDTLGDSKLTGDLAVNYAETGHSTVDGEWKPEAREEAYRRAVELADFHPEAEREDVRAQRQILLAGHLLNDRRFESGMTARARRVLRDLEKRMEALGWTDRTYHGDMHTLLAQSRLLDRNYKKALEEAELANIAFARAGDGLFSVQRYQLPLFEAVAARERGQEVRAGRALQKLVEDHYREIGSYTGPSAVAYGQWLELGDDLRDRADEPDVAALLAWTPPPSVGDSNPSVRVPPVMPPNAKRSGWVRLEYDIRPDGRPDMETMRVLDASEGGTFTEASRKAVEAWVYPPGMPEADRTGLSTTITFQLSDERGNLIPARRQAPPLLED